MPIDLNEAGPYRGGSTDDHPYSDEDEIADALGSTADKWIPEYFPRGRYSQDRRQLALANINGDPPKKEGSCKIELAGPKAGHWCDYSIPGSGGGPLSTLSHALGGIRRDDLFKAARELLERYGGSVAPVRKANGSAGPERNTQLAQALWNQGIPIAGTPAETYLRIRAQFLPDTPDLRFHPSATYPKSNQGHACLLALWRDPFGNVLGGIHRVFTLPDGSWHLGRAGYEKAKFSLGASHDGVIMLAPPDAEGNLGIGEGIETTAAAMRLYGKPGWAAGTGYMRSLGKWIRAHGPPAGVRRLWVWADRGQDGEASARALFEACREAGLPAAVFLPAGPDDFAADLAAGADPQPPVDWFEPGQPVALAAVPVPVVTIDALHKASSTDEVEAALRGALAAAGDDAIEVDRIIGKVARKIGATQISVRRMVRTLRGDKPAAADRPWLNAIQLGDNGEPRANMSNVAIVLREADEWKGVFAYNEFSGMVCIRRKPPYEYNAGDPCADRPFDEKDELATTEYMQRIAGINVRKHDAYDAVMLVAKESKFNPVLEYFDSLPWDGHSRLELLLPYYAGTADTKYHRESGKRWMIGIVARVYRPGEQMDYALILIGEQGIKKSGFFRTLAGEWFTDQIGELGTKDSAMQMRGALIVEVAELEAFGRADITRLKRVISQRDDHFRPPYGKSVQTIPRQFGWAATTNEDQFLRDATGGRRFWPAECLNPPRIAELKRDRDQLWAEAVARYKAGKKWWIDRDEPELQSAAEAEQEKRYQSSEWERVLGDYLATNLPAQITVGDLMLSALGIGKDKWEDRGIQTKVGNAARAAIRKRKLPYTKGRIKGDWFYIRLD